MPEYLFEHLKTHEVRTVFFHMNDDKVYRGPGGTDDPSLWKRVWTKPLASVDTRVDPYSSRDFVKATNKRGSVGDLYDRSKEMSLKRAEKEGSDPVRKTFYEGYSKRRHGAKHPEQRREESAAALAGSGLKVDWGTDD